MDYFLFIFNLEICILFLPFLPTCILLILDVYFGCLAQIRNTTHLGFFFFVFPICCYLPELFLYRPLLISLYILQPIILNSGEHVDGGKKKESRFVVTFVIPQFLFLTFLHYQATGAHGLQPIWRILIADRLGLKKVPKILYYSDLEKSIFPLLLGHPAPVEER